MEPLVGDLADEKTWRPKQKGHAKKGRHSKKTPSTIGPPPTERAMELLVAAAQPLYWYMSPVSYGIENIPIDRSNPVLFVGNHSLYALDIALFLSELWTKKKIIIRPLADHAHFRLPIWREIVKLSGIVEGNPENCDTLMEKKENILVYPGGAREVFKLKGEKYQLIWGNRVGFAKMAIKHNYTIVPFACVGIEDMYDVLIDSKEILASPFGKLAQLVSPTKEVPPIFGGLGGTLIPRPYRLYFWFGPPISTKKYAGQDQNELFARELKEHTKTQVEWGIQFLKKVQSSDKHNLLMKRMEADVRKKPWLRFMLKTILEAWRGEGPGYDPRYAILAAKVEQQRLRRERKLRRKQKKVLDKIEAETPVDDEDDDEDVDYEEEGDLDEDAGESPESNQERDAEELPNKTLSTASQNQLQTPASSNGEQNIQTGESPINAEDGSDVESEEEFEADLLQRRIAAPQFYHDLILEAVRSVSAPFITARL